MYKKSSRNDEILQVCLYVDDIIYMGSSQALIEDFQSCNEEKLRDERPWAVTLLPRIADHANRVWDIYLTAEICN